MSRFRDDPLGAFRQELEQCKRKSNFYDPPQEFVLASRLLEWLREVPEDDETSARATIILEKVYNGREPWPGAWHHFDQTMKKSHSQCWLKLLVILLQMDDDGSFARYLDVFCRAEIWDSKLSDVHRRSSELFHIIQLTGLYDVEQCHTAVQWFIHLARQLSTQKAITMYHMRQLEPHMLLPITAKDDIDSGGQSNVFRIEVPQECVSSDLVNHLKGLQRHAILDDRYPDGKSFYYVFALKRIAMKEDWKREIEFHRALHAAPTEGMVQCLGSWEVQTGTDTEYYLLMEFGWSDLNQYFHSIPPPSIAHHIYLFWRALSNVIPALSHIHNLVITAPHSPTMRYYVWHGDIKPANILICDDGIKLTDPGWAQLVLQEDAKRDERGLPIVVLKGGTGSYGGPERVDQRTGKLNNTHAVTQRFDIWSLACVFLEAATWVILGDRGVDQFRIARKMAHKRGSSNENIGDDCFHDIGRASSVIGDWIEYLERGIRTEDLVSGPILNIIKREMLLVSPHERIPSEALARRIDGTLRSCEDAIKQLPRYTFPDHLEPAFELEQKEAAEVWTNPRSRAPSGKPMLDRSVRFPEPRGPLISNAAQPHELPGSDQWTSGSSLHLRPAHAYYTGSDPINYVHGRSQPRGASMHQDTTFTHRHHQTQSAQWAAAAPPVSHPPTRSPARTPTRDSASTLPPPAETKQPKFDYYDALDLLIRTRGWIYSSHLENPDSQLKPPVSSNPTSSTDVRSATATNEAAGRASTWSHMKRSGSTLRRAERTSGFTSALAQAFHSKFRPPSKLQTTKGSSSADPRVASGSNNARPGATPVQSMQADTNFTALFEDRDIVILVDNSSSMIPRWPQVQNILPLLMAMMWGQDDDGIDLFFTSSTRPYEKLMEPWQVLGPLREKDPRHPRASGSQMSTETNPDDIYTVLEHILGLAGPTKKYRQKVTILILTDGIWPKISNQEVVASHISNWLLRMSTVADGPGVAVLHDRYYSIQFVQVGDDPAGTKALEYLDDDLPRKYNVPDVIDVEPANGNVMKMVMGSLVPEWDDKPQSSEPLSPNTDSSSSRPEPQTSPPPPLPHQYLGQRTGSNYTTTRGGGGAAATIFREPISEEPETDYAGGPPPPPPHASSRLPSPYAAAQWTTSSPPVPHGGAAGYDDLGLPLRNPPQLYGSATPQQPQRRPTGHGQGQGRGAHGRAGSDETPARPRRRDTGDTTRMHGY